MADATATSRVVTPTAPLGRETSLHRLLEALLPFDRVETLVEVGCGSGQLAHWLAAKLAERGGRVVALDIDKRRVELAKREAQVRGLQNVRFHVGDVYGLGLLDRGVDAVVFQKLLCTLRDLDGAMRQMCRIVKPGGWVVGAEPATAQSVHDPEDARFVFLSEKLNSAFYRGWKARGVDQRVGLRLPEVFLRHGLDDIAAEAASQVHLLCDARRSLREVIEQLTTETMELPEDTVALVRKGGISPSDLREHNTRARQRLDHILGRPLTVKRSAYTRVMPTVVVVAGRRQ